ncbi:hypothetical protein OQ252_03565 [Acetobacter farinalis]|uniref:Lipoprotein n=1 Tax=Acetobacter farinalis TaxID=1260984 RepID=A0ABT3Q5B3_9PROT|nr:hypothetical protein [Acetobacter farinalis]MCX2560485.1 hypothetical protein [Acetobacter farinalis]NHO29373.1 hypothetical protein [Acetobacter farinalis]
MKRASLITGCIGLILVGTLSGCAGRVYSRGYNYYGYTPAYSGYDEYYGYGSGPRWGYYAARPVRPYPVYRPGIGHRPGGWHGRPPGRPGGWRPGGGGRPGGGPGGGGHGPGGGHGGGGRPGH